MMAIKFPCGVCEKPCTERQCSIFCDICNLWIHLKCTHLTSIQFNHLSNSNEYFYCQLCLLNTFPYLKMTDSDFNETFSTTSSLYHNFPFQIHLPSHPASTSPQKLHMQTITQYVPDANFYNLFALDPCETISMAEIENKFPKNSTALTIVHVNIRSLQKNCNSLQQFICSFPSTPSIICVSETKLRSNPATDIDIPGYNFFHCPSQTKAGGVAMYVKAELDFLPQSTDMLSGPLIESCWGKLSWNNHCKKKKSNNIVIGVIYRHPSQETDVFIDKLNALLDNLNQNHQNFVILGDININLLLSDKNQKVTNYVNMLTNNATIPLITSPTRVTRKSATLIDHILTNSSKLRMTPSIIEYDISDHFPIACQLRDIKIRHKNYHTLKRDMRNFNQDDFHDLTSTTMTPFHDITLTTDNFDSTFSSFVDDFKSCVDKCAPLRKLTRKERKLKSKPWMSRGILISIQTKQKMYRSHFHLGNDFQVSHYKAYSRLLSHITEKAKQRHYRKIFSDSKTDISKTWKAIKSLLHSKKNNSQFPEQIKQSGLTISDPEQICATFNNYFSTIGSTLSEKFDKHGHHFKTYLQNPISSSIYFTHATANEITVILAEMKSEKACGHDNIPIRFVKPVSDILSSLIAKFYNASVDLSLYPTPLKIAKVTPIFKSGEKYSISNYRPISVLSCFAIIFEKLLLTRLTNFLDKHNIIQPLQFGFRRSHSTTHAMLDMIAKIYEACEKRNYTACILLDIKKAFDSIDHKILLQKLNHYGVRGGPHNLIKSYLSNRSQFVSHNDCHSSKCPITHGVPQGGPLSPLLFILYMNDLPTASNFCTRLFADDTCLEMSCHDPSILESSINTEIIKIEKWLYNNRLTLNSEKTQLLTISPTPKVFITTKLNISNSTILSKKSVKYLGLFIDHDLSWSTHINHVTNKLSQCVGAMYKIKRYVSTPTLRTIYFALFYSKITYAVAVWGSANKSQLKKVYSLQRRAIKLITKKKNITSNLFGKQKILKFDDVFEMSIASLMHKFKNNDLPSTFSDYFMTPTHAHYTRSSKLGNLDIPRFSNNKTQKSFKYIGSKIWNNLPTMLRSRPPHLFRQSYIKWKCAAYQLLQE